jgi:flagellin-like hook-associated protein FlgL
MHINRNMRNLDNIIRQLETTKRVSRPSDDPLIASRALKFRSSVTEVQQFQRNVDFGRSWMDVTESSFLNILDHQLQEIRQLLVTGASGTYNIDNKHTMVTQIRELVDHIATLEMNQTYAGRYVFSGFRTDEQPVFTASNDRRFVITQHFNLSDVDRTSSFQRLGENAATDPPVAHRVNVVRLAYRNLDMATPNDISTMKIQIPGFHVVPMSINNENAYLPPATVGELRVLNNDNQFNPPLVIPNALSDDTPVLFFIPETGELTMHDTTAAAFPREGIAVTFEKTGFDRGELNPAVYFTSREIIDEEPQVILADRVYQVTQYFSRAAGVRPPGEDFYIFGLAYDAAFLNNDDPETLRPLLPPGAVIIPPLDPTDPDSVYTVRIPAIIFDRNQNVSISYSVELSAVEPDINDPRIVIDPSIIDPVEIAAATEAAAVALAETDTLAAMHAIKTNPSVQGVKLLRASVPNVTPLVPIPLDQAERNRSFDMHDQRMTIEAASHTHIPVNSLAKDVFTPQMFADLRRLIEFTDSITISDETELKRRLSQPPFGYTEPELSNIVERQLVDERAIANDALYTHFNNMLFLIDRHIDQVTREHTQLGARMQRLDMLRTRLEADEVSYERLTSENEDTDMYRAVMLRINAEAAFQASLRANSGIIQMSLANFIR